jgi:DtxR family transcriptional regulator, Mn-dependent transcriptional regulator
MLTFVEENYLKAIFNLSLETEDKVTTTSIAEEISTTPGSVTDMIKKLSGKKLIKHEKYQGVKLTAEGEKIALAIIRKHRLWEVFLVNTLEFSWDEVHEIAEQLEHIRSDKLTEKLDKFLGHPSTDPHGDPIPDMNGKIKSLKNIPLSRLQKGQSGVFTGVKKSDPELLRYLDKMKIELGRKLLVTDVIEFDGSIQIDSKGKQLMVSKQIADNLLVEKKS